MSVRDAVIHVREDLLLGAVADFFSSRIFGPQRRETLLAELGDLDDRAKAQREAGVVAARRGIAEIDGRITRLVHTLEVNDDPSGAMFTRVQARISELESRTAGARRRAGPGTGRAVRGTGPGTA